MKSNNEPNRSTNDSDEGPLNGGGPPCEICGQPMTRVYDPFDFESRGVPDFECTPCRKAAYQRALEEFLRDKR